jgi:hypothetical protein
MHHRNIAILWRKWTNVPQKEAFCDTWSYMRHGSFFNCTPLPWIAFLVFKNHRNYKNFKKIV